MRSRVFDALRTREIKICTNQIELSRFNNANVARNKRAKEIQPGHIGRFFIPSVPFN